MLDLDLSDPINQVRALLGDLDGSFINDTNIQFLLDKYNGNVNRASLEAFSYILSQVAYYVREEAGDVEVYWQDIYNQLSKRKQDLEKETVYKRTGSVFFFGGTTRSEIDRVKNDPESKGVGVSVDDFTALLKRLKIDPDNPYYLERR